MLYVAVNVTAGGSGYTASTSPSPAATGGTGATATASGGVDAVTITDAGSGYTMPTVDFDLPDDPNGTIAKAHVDHGRPGRRTAASPRSIVDDPGSGYTTAPDVAIHNGTVTDPIAAPPGRGRARDARR